MIKKFFFFFRKEKKIGQNNCLLFPSFKTDSSIHTEQTHVTFSQQFLFLHYQRREEEKMKISSVIVSHWSPLSKLQLKAFLFSILSKASSFSFPLHSYSYITSFNYLLSNFKCFILFSSFNVVDVVVVSPIPVHTRIYCHSSISVLLSTENPISYVALHGFRSTCYYPEGEILPFFPLFDVNLFPIFEIFFLWQLTLTRVSNLYEVGGVAWVVAATNDEQGEKLSNPSTRFADSEKEIFPWKWSSAWILLLFLWFCCCFHCSRLL